MNTTKNSGQMATLSGKSRVRIIDHECKTKPEHSRGRLKIAGEHTGAHRDAS